MNITFTKIELHNFCGISDAEYDLFDRTIIKGVNQSGKTTIKNSIFWLLFNKLADGSAADGIRPHDKDGVDEDLIEISVALTMDIDGKVVKATKTQKQNWIKDKTTQEQKFKGNTNEYDINGIPKKEKDFVEYMSQFISLDNLMFCSNPFVFLRMSTKDRRATLFSLLNDNVDAEIIGANPCFESLKNELMDGTVEELIARSKHAITSLKDDLKAIPERIDEVKREIEEITDDEKKALEAELAECNAKLLSIDTLSETSNELSKRITDARNRISRLETDSRILQQKAEADANIKKGNLTNAIAMAKGTIANIQKDMENAKNRMSDIRTCIAGYATSIKEVENEKFDDSNLTCPVCGSKYTKAKAEGMKKAWQESHNAKIDQLTHLSEDSELRYHEIERDLFDWDQNISAKRDEIEKFEKELAKLDAAPAPTVDDPNAAEVEKLAADIVKWEKELSTLSLSSGAEKQAILDRISEITITLHKQDTNDAHRTRIKELTDKQLQTAQSIANEEKMLDLLKDYQRAKIDLVTDEINSYFTVIKWQFYKEQINGGFAEVCLPLVNGTSYDGLLNHGDKLLAEIDLCSAFQKKAGVTCPIIIDDTESLDEWRIPKIDSQLICIRRTDDKSLIVESLS